MQTRRSLWLGALLALAAWPCLAQTAPLRVATFDSGFGGFLSAKAIEETAGAVLRDYDLGITIKHYGDTLNAPYGVRPPAEIAALGAAGVLRALEQGADVVFIACNTASTQEAAIRRAVEARFPGRGRDLVFIISMSVAETKRAALRALESHDRVRVLVLATPATARSGVYPRLLAEAFGAPPAEEASRPVTQARWARPGETIESRMGRSILSIGDGKTIEVVQASPANWVELVEGGAALDVRRRVIGSDVSAFAGLEPGFREADIVAFFCTHYPVLGGDIAQALGAARVAGDKAVYITQAGLMASAFQALVAERYGAAKRSVPLGETELAVLRREARPEIEITGDNGEITRRLVQAIYPNDPQTRVTTVAAWGPTPGRERRSAAPASQP